MTERTIWTSLTPCCALPNHCTRAGTSSCASPCTVLARPAPYHHRARPPAAAVAAGEAQHMQVLAIARPLVLHRLGGRCRSHGHHPGRRKGARRQHTQTCAWAAFMCANKAPPPVNRSTALAAATRDLGPPRACLAAALRSDLKLEGKTSSQRSPQQRSALTVESDGAVSPSQPQYLNIMNLL